MSVHALAQLFSLSLTIGTEAPAAETDPAGSSAAPASAKALPPGTSALPPRPRWRGIGLLAGTATLSGGALAVVIARNIVLKKNCPLDDMAANQCTYDLASDLGFSITHWSLNFAAVGLAPAAGVMMGRYAAWSAAAGQGPQRRPGLIAGVGGGLLGLGIVGLGTAAALSFVLPLRCVDEEREMMDPLAGDRCLLRAFPAWTMLNWSSFAMIGSGAALLAFGGAYKRSRARLDAFYPLAGRGLAGVGVAGAF